MICEYRGMDVNKRVKGRKRDLVVDTDGRLWVVDVHAANEAEGPAAVPLISTILWRAGERVEKVYGDQSYNGVFAQALAEWSIDFLRRFLVLNRLRDLYQLPGGGSLNRSAGAGRLPGRIARATPFLPRIVKDYEYTLSSSLSWLYLANIQIMLQRI